MHSKVLVLPLWTKDLPDGIVVNTTSGSGCYKDLSPFILGPVESYIRGVYSKNFENLWQFSKVYKCHLDNGNSIREEWLDWRYTGWNDYKAHRYPMGRGMKPEFSFWDDERLSYVEARKKIYAPIYAKYVRQTESFQLIRKIYIRDESDIILLDYDAYDHEALGMTLSDVINCPYKKMGHAFVLKMMLMDVLVECCK